MSEAPPRLTDEQAIFIAEIGADPGHALASAAPGGVFVYQSGSAPGPR